MLYNESRPSAVSWGSQKRIEEDILNEKDPDGHKCSEGARSSSQLNIESDRVESKQESECG